MDVDNDYEDRCEDMHKEDDNGHSMQTVVTINNCMWPWSRHKLICMVLHKPVQYISMNKQDALYENHLFSTNIDYMYYSCSV